MTSSQSETAPTVGNEFARKSFGVTVALTISAALEFARDVYTAHAVGTGMLTDAYFLAIVVPLTLVGAMNAIGQVVLLPWFSATLSSDPKKSYEHLFLLAFVTLLPTLLIVFTGILASPLVADLLGGSVINEELLTAVTRIVLPVVGFSIELAIFSAFLNASGRYIIVGLRKTLNGVTFLVVLIIVGPNVTAPELGWAFLAGYVVELVALFIIAFPKLRIGTTAIAFRHWNDLVFLLKGSLFPALVIGFARINLIAERVLAGYLAVGSVTAVTLARRVTLGVAAVAAQGINIVTLSRMSRLRNTPERLMQLASSLRLALLILVPIATVFAVFHDQITMILFAGRQSDPAILTQTSELILLFGLGTPLYVLVPLLLGAFYAVGDTRTPSIQEMVAVLLNLILNLLLTWFLGTRAFGVSFIITVFFATLWAWRSVNTQFGRFTSHWLVSFVSKILVASVGLAAASYFVFRRFAASTPNHDPLGASIALGVSFAVGGLVLCISLFMLHVEEAEQTWRRVRYRMQSGLR